MRAGELSPFSTISEAPRLRLDTTTVEDSDEASQKPNSSRGDWRASADCHSLPAALASTSTGSAILNADTNSEEIKYTASQTAGQPDLRVKVVEVVRIGFQDFTIVNWSSNLATGTGPVDRGWFIDSHYLIGAKSWSLYTCMEADHSDCKLWETWTAP